MSPRLVLFDCDGTLVDSAAVIIGAMRAAFERHDLAPPTTAEIRGIIGLSLPIAISNLCAKHPDAPVEAITAAYRIAYRDTTAREAAQEPLFPGTVDALAKINDDDTLLGVVTGKSRAGLSRVLAAHGLADQFVVSFTADDAASKPSPEMVEKAIAETGADVARTAVIGDTTFDIEMAVNAGVHPIGVAWGYHAPDRLTAAGAKAIAGTMADLPGLVANLMGETIGHG
ncbi:HAD-IA family hydrolase [Acuticoccus mangrovi]|uniref:HAD-IA family hydrolase n=1 Tax=Acuticoccus mangrovi TaxID=2796142 RepID=A0A934MHZ5_9HYPH|nr:HAD-IA family hydrolase [Acuticoccus mangrovi]MBJ3778213.1 HAD-IA family hydrolase [Acuticoccus mangrovi]